MHVLKSGSIIALVTLITLSGCQYADTRLENQLKKEPSEVMQKLFNIDTDRQFYITFS